MSLCPALPVPHPHVVLRSEFWVLRILFMKVSVYQMGERSHQFPCNTGHVSLGHLQSLLWKQLAWVPPGHLHGMSKTKVTFTEFNTWEMNWQYWLTSSILVTWVTLWSVISYLFQSCCLFYATKNIISGWKCSMLHVNFQYINVLVVLKGIFLKFIWDQVLVVTSG